MELADQGPFAADVFARLALELHESPGMEQTVEAVAQFALKALNCTYAGVALASRGKRPEIAATTDPVVEDVYRLQIESRKGPLVEVFTEGHTVLVRDTATDGRWPEWACKVSGLGVRSVLDVPLSAGDQTIGVIGLYSDAPDGFGPDDDGVAHILARHASVAVSTTRLEETMAQAVDARKLIGQAMGILMERYDVGDDRAFAILKRYSQDYNVKLRDVALQLVETRRLPRQDRAAD